jgi:hypothetical protein
VSAFFEEGPARDIIKNPQHPMSREFLQVIVH